MTSVVLHANHRTSSGESPAARGSSRQPNEETNQSLESVLINCWRQAMIFGTPGEPPTREVCIQASSISTILRSISSILPFLRITTKKKRICTSDQSNAF